jgi:hypothetical protein
VVGYQFSNANNNVRAKVEASGVGVEGRGAIPSTTDFESLLNQLEVLDDKLVMRA